MSSYDRRPVRDINEKSPAGLLFLSIYHLPYLYSEQVTEGPKSSKLVIPHSNSTVFRADKAIVNRKKLNDSVHSLVNLNAALLSLTQTNATEDLKHLIRLAIELNLEKLTKES